jgi:hypothetical protein
MSLLDALLLDPYRINVWIAYRTDGVKGSGTQNDPYDGSTATRFDALMSGLTANTRVHLGPGIFQTSGYAEGVSGGWQPKAGMSIAGSGIDVTTLQLAGASTTNKHYFAIGHPFTSGGQPNLMDYFEVSELTIDCNLASATTQTACGAVRILGNSTRVRRIKVVNWGKKTGGPDCFVIAMITADPGSGVAGVNDTGIEECMAITPGSGNVGPVTIFHAGPQDDTGTNAEGYGTGAVIRNNFADCGWPTDTTEARGLSLAWCKAGVVEGNQIHNTKYGGPCLTKASSRDVTVRNNFYKNVAKGPFWNLGTLSASSLSTLVRDTDHTIAIAATTSAHGMLAGDRVKIDVAGAASFYEGIFVIKDVPSSTTFRYQMQGDPLGNGSSPTMQKIFGVSKLVVEGNTVELATGSTGSVGIHIDDSALSPQAPDYAHGDVIVRDNKIRYVDGAFDPGFSGYGVQVNGAKNVLVRNNVVETAQTPLLRNNRCGSVKYFNDKTPAGALIQGVDEGNSNKKYDELETDAEDAMVLALFNRR